MQIICNCMQYKLPKYVVHNKRFSYLLVALFCLFGDYVSSSVLASQLSISKQESAFSINVLRSYTIEVMKATVWQIRQQCSAIRRGVWRSFRLLSRVVTVVVHIGEPSYLLQQRAEFLNSVASRELRGKPELERTLSAEPPEKKIL